MMNFLGSQCSRVVAADKRHIACQWPFKSFHTLYIKPILFLLSKTHGKISVFIITVIVTLKDDSRHKIGFKMAAVTTCRQNRVSCHRMYGQLQKRSVCHLLPFTAVPLPLPHAIAN